MKTNFLTPRIYFLDVGQGDSEAIIIQGTSFLIDGGPDRSAAYELDKIVPGIRRYVDIIFLTHPNTDHLNGIREILKSYDIGVLVYAEEQIDDPTLKEFLERLAENRVPVIGLREGDSVRYSESVIDILSPGENEKNFKDINDQSLVLLLKTFFGKALFVGDIGSAGEKNLMNQYDISAEILKVGHHGSKYSSGSDFLKAVNPAAAIIEVGKNSYGHPANKVLEGLKTAGAKTYRTDELGTITATFGREGFKIMKIR